MVVRKGFWEEAQTLRIDFSEKKKEIIFEKAGRVKLP